MFETMKHFKILIYGFYYSYIQNNPKSDLNDAILIRYRTNNFTFQRKCEIFQSNKIDVIFKTPCRFKKYDIYNSNN